MKLSKTKKFSLLIIFLVALTVGVSDLSAQQMSDKLPPSVTTTGEAIVTAKPDRAQIDIGVVTQAVTSQEAVTKNAQLVDTTLADLRRVIGAGADLKTISYSVSPDYQYPKDGGEPKLTGYTATNVVRATLDDLSIVGKVIDTAAATGANRIQNLQFRLKDETAVQTQALREAAIKARQKSEALVSALGLRTLRVLMVTESSDSAVPVRQFTYSRAEAASTPIEPGTIEVRASVTYSVEIGQ